MTPASDPLGKLAESVADGDPLDWDALDAIASDEDVRRLVQHLRIVAGVAEVHRSLVDDDVDNLTIGGDHLTDGSSPGTSRRWGHLVLIRRIGQGAFGEVYQAHDTWLDHPRALKLVKTDVASRVSPSQLLHEARKLVRVRHPNVVTVHGADRHDGRVGFWMDLIEGQTLADRVGEGRLSAGEATHIGQELCRALAAVHQANLVHRDIKAQNVMRAADGGRIILMDFGAGEFMNETPSGRLQGTPLYLAPELFQGGAATVSTDLYALGVLLYYLVTSRFPVEGQSFEELAEAHQRRRRRRLRDARPDLPDRFVTVVEQAIDPDPRRRLSSAGDMEAALGEPVGLTVGSSAFALSSPAPPATGTVHHANDVILAVGAVLVTIETLGFLESRTFEVALHVDAAFTAGPAEYFRLGTEALLPFAIYWLGGAVAIVVLGAVRLSLGAFMKRIWNRAVALVDAVQPMTLATTICVLGAAGWMALVLSYRNLFASVIALQIATPGNTPDVAVLGPAFHAMHVGYSARAAWLSFGLLYAVLRWFPRLEQHSADPPAVRRMRWATLALTFLVVSSAIAPRRIAWERFELVLYQKHPSFVIGTNGDELLLYAADRIDTDRLRVHRDDPELVRTTNTRTLVDR